MGRKIVYASLALAALAVSAGCFKFLAGRGTAPPTASASVTAVASAVPQGPYEVAEVVFSAGFGKGWEDWGWGPRENPPGGPLRVGLTGYGGITFRHEEFDVRFGALIIRYRTPNDFGDALTVSLKGEGLDDDDVPRIQLQPSHVTKLESGFREALLPMSLLNPSQRPFDRIVIQGSEFVSAGWLELDKVLLTKPGAASATNAPARNVKLVIDCSGKAQPINPLIYGVAGAPPEAGASATRIGGNRLSRLNWDLGTTNTGSDWFFENVADGGSPFEWLKGARKSETKTAIVVPAIGWVAKDAVSVGFPISKLGPQRSHDPHRPDAGDGTRADGTPLRPGPPTETSIPAPPELIRGWIERLRREDAAAGGRSVHMYIIDNEPDVWHVTHRDVHPEPVGYDELLDRTLRYGSAIRAADPDAVIAGPASWGYSGYFYSALDQAKSLIPNTDRLRHGGIPLLPWYLQKLADHEKKTGTRVLDVLDVHYYPQADGVCQGGSRTDEATAALRLRSTRSLWDPSYRDESWIGERVKLIPMLRDWVDKNYPGRRISLGEWSFCAEHDVSGGLAMAEALGRFGRHGLDSAFFWGKIEAGSPAFWAFRAFRNFDGSGGRFLDLSLPTTEGGQVSLFASRDGSGSRVVAVALNLDPASTAKVEIDVSSCGNLKSQRVFGYGRDAPQGLAAKPAAAGGSPPDGRRVIDAIPGYALSVIDLTFDRPVAP